MSRRSRPLPPPTAAERAKVLDDARHRLDGAEFFLSNMRHLDRSPNLEARRGFQHYFEAFLAAARSSLQIACGKRPMKWIKTATTTWAKPEQDLFDMFHRLRNVSIHVEKVQADEGVVMLLEHELPPRHRTRSAQGVIYLPAAPGMAPTKVGAATYSLNVGGAAVDALKCCAEYLDLVRRLIDHREQMGTW